MDQRSNVCFRKKREFNRAKEGFGDRIGVKESKEAFGEAVGGFVSREEIVSQKSHVEIVIGGQGNDMAIFWIAEDGEVLVMAVEVRGQAIEIEKGKESSSPR